ncbi:MAG: hypothetical protein KAW39_03160 [Thermoplasmata archaeon]|nr:hypothetical protein [Thermoplasmata archaeon]
MEPRHYSLIAVLLLVLGFVLPIITAPILEPTECWESLDPLGPSVIIFASFCVAALVFLGIAYGKERVGLADLLATAFVLIVFVFVWLVYMSIVPRC